MVTQNVLVVIISHVLFQTCKNSAWIVFKKRITVDNVDVNFFFSAVYCEYTFLYSRSIFTTATKIKAVWRAMLTPIDGGMLVHDSKLLRMTSNLAFSSFSQLSQKSTQRPNAKCFITHLNFFFCCLCTHPE